MQDKNRQFIEGLQPIPAGRVVYSHAVVFGASPLEELPNEFFTSDPLVIKNQEHLDFCGTFSGTAVSEDQEGTELDPLSLFAWAKELKGIDAWKEFGLNLLDVGDALRKVGALAMEYAPYKMGDHERDFLADPANYPAELKMLAADHRKASYFDVDGPHDTFDNIRNVIWQNRSEHRSVLTGTLWRKEWTEYGDGIIPTEYGQDSIGGHAIKVFGWMEVKGEPHLIVQNSWGTDIGDKGLFYFPREVVNREFIFGAIVFKDIDKGLAEYHNDNGLRIDANPFYKLIVVLKNVFLSFIGIKK